MRKKAFLCENGICHRCCVSISYLAEDFEIPMKCSKFESECHIDDMHPGPALHALKVPTRAPEHSKGGEGLMSAPAVKSHWNEIYCEGQSAMPCSKICLV